MATTKKPKTGERGIRQIGPDRYEVRATLPKDPRTGRAREVSRVHTGTLAGARKVRRQLLHDVDSGKYGGTQGTFGKLLDEWNDHREAIGLSPSTIAKSRRRIDQEIRPVLGSVTCNKLTTAVIRSFYDNLARANRSWSMQLSVHRDVSAAINYGRALGSIVGDPMVTLPNKPKVRSRVKTVPTPDQVVALVEAAKIPDAVRVTWGMDTMIAIAALTGLREGELCALRFSDVDFVTGVITVQRSIVQAGSKRRGDYVCKPKATKSGRVRSFKLSADALAILRHRHDLLVESADVVEQPVTPDPYVWFTDEVGADFVKPTSVANAFSRLKTREGVDCRFHDLRVLNGSQLLSHHVDLRTISDRLGHADVSITANIYTHGIAATDALAADVIDNVLPLGRAAIGSP